MLKQLWQIIETGSLGRPLRPTQRLRAGGRL